MTDTPILLRTLRSPLGLLHVGATERGICFLEFSRRARARTEIREVRAHFQRPLAAGSNRHLRQIARELDQYFAGKRAVFTVPLDLFGTPFELSVWQALQRIPPGTTLSYGRMARRLGRPAAARAVGRANGRNRIAIVIPCHRLVESTGGLRAYGGGLWRKRFLLELETSLRR